MSRKYREKGIRRLTLAWMLCLAVMLSGCGVSGGDGQITKMDEKYLAEEESAAPQEAGEKEAAPEGGQETDAKSEKEQGKENGKSPTDSDGEKGTSSSKKNQEPGDKQKNSSEKPTDNSQKSSKDERDTANAKNTNSNSAKSKNDSREKSSSADKDTVSEKKDSSQKKDSSDSVQREDSKKDRDSIGCYISIDCKNILAHMSQLNENKRDYVPRDGVILQRTKVTVEPGASVYDVLYQVCREKKIHLEASYTPMYKSYYVEGIHQLYEFDCGNLSGWNYTVNGVQPSLGCSKYQVKEGDEIAWRFTYERGKDL